MSLVTDGLTIQSEDGPHVSRDQRPRSAPPRKSAQSVDPWATVRPSGDSAPSRTTAGEGVNVDGCVDARITEGLTPEGLGPSKNEG